MFCRNYRLGIRIICILLKNQIRRGIVQRESSLQHANCYRTSECIKRRTITRFWSTETIRLLILSCDIQVFFNTGHHIWSLTGALSHTYVIKIVNRYINEKIVLWFVLEKKYVQYLNIKCFNINLEIEIHDPGKNNWEDTCLYENVISNVEFTLYKNRDPFWLCLTCKDLEIADITRGL